MTRLALRLLFVVALAGAVSACDSSDGGDPDPSDVAGVYTVTAFTFGDTNVPVVGSVNVLDTLATDQTSLEILDGGQVLFRYRLRGAGSTSRLLTGEASVRTEQVRITFEDGSETLRRRLLLPNQITFDRDGGTLTAEAVETVNLEAFSPRFGTSGALQSVRGTLRLTLTPQG